MALRFKVVTPDIENIVEVALDSPVYEAMGEAAVDALHQTAGRSDGWPVDTGFSLSRFNYEVEDGEFMVTNDADYAQDVEDRTGAAERTLSNALPRIVEAGERALEGELNG